MNDELEFKYEDIVWFLQHPVEVDDMLTMPVYFGIVTVTRVDVMYGTDTEIAYYIYSDELGHESCYNADHVFKTKDEAKKAAAEFLEFGMSNLNPREERYTKLLTKARDGLYKPNES